MVVTAVYSKTPLFKKLGIKEGMRVLPVKPPENYFDLIEGAPVFRLLRRRTANVELVHIFLHGRKDLANVGDWLQILSSGGILWISWAKKSSSKHNDISEDDLRAAILPLGWVDTKVCAVDEDWSGLKFLKRKSV